MALENLVSVQLSSAQLQDIKTKISEIKAILLPQLISLTAVQRKELPKMGEGTSNFVTKALEYAKTNPEFVPPFVKVEDLEIDVRAVSDLLTIYRPLEKLMSMLDDTMVLSGSEAYVASLSIYNSLKQANKTNVPGAKSILADLKTRFENQGTGNNGNGSTPQS